MSRSDNVLMSRLIPVRCSDGSRAIIAAYEIGGMEDGRTPIYIDFANELLNDATTEALAGVLQTIMAPATQAEWIKTWTAGVTPDQMKAKFAPYVQFFNIYGEAPVFQVADAAQAKNTKLWPIGRLIRDVVGEVDTLEELGHHGISVGAAIFLTYGIQSHAHAGGNGYKTSLAGGGPLRTVPVIGDTLFQKIWALVIDKPDFDELGSGSTKTQDLFPWTALPRTSASRADAAASTLYFALPRRILLTEPRGEGECPLGGGVGALVFGILEGPSGTDYQSTHWTHPLTPYSRADGKMLPVLADRFSNGVAWNNRIGLFYDEPGEDGLKVRQARVIAVARERLTGILGNRAVLPIHAYGHRFKNANYTGPLSSMQPLRLLDDELILPHEMTLRGAAKAASEIEFQLKDALADAQVPDNVDPKKRKKAKSAMKGRLERQVRSFWSSTQEAFDELDENIAHYLIEHRNLRKSLSLPSPVEPQLEKFLRAMVSASQMIFDAALPEPSPNSHREHAKARNKLGSLSSDFKARQALDLPVAKNDVFNKGKKR